MTQALDAEETSRLRRARAERIGRWLMPMLTVVAALVIWDRIVVWNQIPHYILPGPGLVAKTLVKDWSILGPATWVTLKIAMMALTVAVIGGASSSARRSAA
jgi:NitT/TauT family transport system permease protein